MIRSRKSNKFDGVVWQPKMYRSSKPASLRAAGLADAVQPMAQPAPLPKLTPCRPDAPVTLFEFKPNASVRFDLQAFVSAISGGRKMTAAQALICEALIKEDLNIDPKFHLVPVSQDPTFSLDQLSAFSDGCRVAQLGALIRGAIQ